MSETLDIIKTRRSVRSFEDKPVPKELLDQVLEAGTWAATGMGRQSPVIIAIADKKLRDEISARNAAVMGKGPELDPFYGAPVILIVLAEKSLPTYVYDGTLVLGNMMLAARDVGLDTCYIFRAKEEFESDEGKALLTELGIEGDYEGIGHLALGYAAAPAPDPAPRKSDYIRYVAGEGVTE